MMMVVREATEGGTICDDGVREATEGGTIRDDGGGDERGQRGRYDP